MVSSRTTTDAERLQSICAELTNSRTDDDNNKKKGAQDSHSSENLPFQVPGKEKRVRLTPGCAETVSKLSKALQHRSAGQTVEWLLNQAKAHVEAVLGPPTTTTNSQPPPPPPAPRVLTFSSPPMPAPVPPPSTDVVPSSNQLSSVPVVVDAGDNARMPLPIAWPQPVLASARSRRNRAEDDDAEICADKVARFLYGPRA